MLNIVKDFLLNLFFILLPIFTIPIWIEQRKVPKHIKQHLLTIFYAFVIILCITIPVGADKVSIFDLRQIPLWLGSLYRGIATSAFLCLVTVGYRSLFEGAGFFVTAVTSVLVMGTSIVLSKKFLQLPSKHRISLATALSAFSGIITIGLAELFHGIPSPSVLLSLTYLLVQPICMFIACSLKEMVYHNIALRKRMIRAEKMEAVSHLAASISHEIRNPLTAARGFMQLLEQHHLSPEKRRQYARIAIEELDRAEAIITDYLTFAKPAPETVEKLNVKTEIERVIDFIRPLANMNSVEVRATLAPFSIIGEREKFRQCLLNIMKNAIEAMPNGGVLQIYVSIEKRRVLIRISDTGVGMTKEQMERLGEPYFTTKEIKGTGLGMMVVYRIIESMNGTIHIQSEIHKGTEVSIYLPLSSSHLPQEVRKAKKIFAVL
ncbi:ATP-binding protein [Saccharococcus caldoxylosilyticus]|jgi:two-component system, sporulation sensor kinase B|uniref:ATP-binding protein n=1 Tax=Saccharococcus caldoxylosilyticus TaxID=81408 RepID=UPI0002F55175|nr:ATP-binding protein [Parageobacillus caldoxylosilyticus]QXJ40303.1 Sporulation kinase A [Parageobacillus caldoxylosilyticus]BDG36036.1 sensor histidine kinase [Parageobacillus caldoxylosilyticus]BDG39819.1 sensor histidine kinase [Parageobacillus caldoxylosilyticus]BDG43588.1 sensor histidine kinase [Parageobacillus caldoxylosilyticus]